MRRWSPWDTFESGPKKPPPADGIRMKKAGTTWWGKRWIEALETVLGGASGRLARGRTYARTGRTHDLVVSGGKVTAKVTGSGPAPYTITIEVGQLPAATWKAAIASMAEQARFGAELLAGRMPNAIDEVFRAAGTSLFPARRADLTTHCSCPDWGDPCKHVAATHYVLGEALDREPFLLFELRGRTKEQVLGALRAARSGEAPGKPANAQQQEIPSVTLGPLTPEEYDRPRAAVPALHFAFDAPSTHGAVLRQLGAPATWNGERSPSDVLAPLVRAAAERARSMATAEAEAHPQSVPIEPPTPPKRETSTRKKEVRRVPRKAGAK